MKDTLNLLPAAASAKKREKNSLLIFISAVIVIYLVLLTGLRIRTGMEIKKVISEKDSLIASRTGLKAKITSAQTATATAKPSALSEIAENLGSSRQWSLVISELSRIVPEKVWLSSLDIRQDPGIITLKGYATGQIEIASFIAAIERSDLFEGVEIVSTQKGQKELSFEVKAKITWPNRT